MTRLVPADIADALETGAANWAGRTVVRFRDLLLLRQDSLVTVIACDSNAGIGCLPNDVLRQSPRLTGYAAAKVPLMEVLAAGAAPGVVVNTLGLALDGHGREILAGIESCVRSSGYDPVITGSDETNIDTAQTSVGVTVVGFAPEDRLRLGRARAGDVVVVLGQPMDGLRIPYNEDDPLVVTPRDVAVLVASDAVHEVLPVGSRGVAYEAHELGRTSELAFVACDSAMDLSVSAGSSTCVILACRPENLTDIGRIVSQPLTRIGHLEI